MIYLLLYVDDMLIIYHDKDEIDHLKSLLSCKFEIKDLGVRKNILSMEIAKERKMKLIFLT